MKRLIIFTVGVCLLLAAVPATAQIAADKAAIRQANEQRLAAWNAKDVKAYLPFFDEDCTNGWAGGPCAATPRDTGAFAETQKNAQVKILEDIGIVFVTPDVAIHRYTHESSGLLDEEDGKPLPPQKAQRANVFVRKGGKWLLAVFLMQPIEE
jgi:ketosteroid isomerase-like protein